MAKFLLNILACFLATTIYGQLTCGTTTKVLNAGALGDIPNNVSSYTYFAATYNMPLNMHVAKVGGNGPNFYHTVSGNNIWVGKDNNIPLDYEDVVITFGGDVMGVSIDFVAINNNSDGEERIQNIFPQTVSGIDVTTGVTYNYQPGVPNGTSATATQYNATTHTITCDPGTADDGRLNIMSTTPFRKVRFRHKEFSSLSASGPNGVLLQRIAYCPYIPDITVTESAINVANNGTIAFGTTNVGTPILKTFTISNIGTAPLTLGTPVISGSDFSITTMPSLSIAVGSTSTMTIQYNPLTATTSSGNVSFSTNDWNENPYTINFTGSSITPEINVFENGNNIADGSTYTLTGTTTVGSSNSYTFTINNSGNAGLTIGTISENSTESSISSQAASSVTLGGSTTFTFLFTPTTAGTKNILVSFANNDLDENPYNFTLQLTALPAPAPEIAVDFNGTNVTDGSTLTIPASVPLNNAVYYTFTIQNTGNANLSVNSVTENHIETNVTVQPSTNIAGGSSSLFTLSFVPTTLGTKTVNVSFGNNDSNENPFNFTLVINAVNGISPEIDLKYGTTNIANLSSTTIAGNTNIGSQNDYIFTIKNIGTAPLTVGTVTENHAEASIWNQPASNVNAGGQTSFIVRFAPTTVGTKAVPISIPNNDANENPYLFTVNLNAVGITPTAPEISLTQATSNLGDGGTINYGGTTVGTPILKTYTIANQGTSNLTFSNILTNNATDFTITAQPSSLNLAPGASSTFSIRYNAVSAGVATCSASFTNNDANENPYNFTISASATAPVANLSSCGNCNALNVNSNPHDDAIWMDRNPRLKWQHDEGRGITSYTVEVKKDAGGGSYTIPVSISGNTVNTVAAPGSAIYAFLDVSGNVFTYNSWYQWKVTGYNSANYPIACFIRTFRVVPSPAILATPNSTCSNQCGNCNNIPGGVTPFGTILGDFNNIPIYKNGGCESGSGCSNNCYNPWSSKIVSQSGWGPGWQCVEYPHRYYQRMYDNMNIGNGNGKDYYSVSNVGRQGFRQFPNNQSSVAPQAGDIITFSSPSSLYGHTAIVKSISPAISPGVSNYTINIAQQNLGYAIGAHTNGTISLKRKNGKWYAGKFGTKATLGWIRGIPTLVEPGDNNAVPVVNSTTPDFIWAKHKNIKKYTVKLFYLSGNCYQEVVGSPIVITGNNFSGLSFPPLTPGETYKWYVVNQFTNNKSIRSDSYYFTVDNNAVPTASNAPVIVAAGNRSHLLIQSIGSQIDNAYLWFKNDSTWNILGATANNGMLEIEQEIEILAGDSLMIERKGYSPLKFVVTNDMLNGNLFLPMFNDTQTPSAVKVEMNNNQLFTTSQTVNLKVTGVNFDGYFLGGGGWGFEYDTHLPSDSLIALTLPDSGLNIVSIHYYKGTDTFSVNKEIYFVPSLSGTSYPVTLNNPSNARMQVLLNQAPLTEISGTTTLNLPLGISEITLMGFGYEPESYVIDTTATISVLAVQKPPFNYTKTLSFGQDSVQYAGAYMTVKYTGNQNITVSREPANVGLAYTAVSESFMASKPSPDNAKLQLAVILDKINVPASGFYVLIERNGVTNLYTQSQFGDSIVYEPDYQILKFLALKGDEKLTLVVSATPLPVTFVEINAQDKENQYIQVDWTVAKELNNHHFEVERSTDALNFYPLSQINSIGNHTNTVNYKYDDHDVLVETNYHYRIKAIDIDGKESYSNLATGRIQKNPLFVIQLYPNPASNLLNIEVVSSIEGKISIQVMNNLGQIISNSHAQLLVGTQSISFDVSKLSAGSYWLKLGDENGNVDYKNFIKE